MKKIVSATIGPMPTGFTDFRLPKVTATFEGGEVKQLFSFYPDELSFDDSEFIGLTEREAHELFTKKDIANLRNTKSIYDLRYIRPSNDMERFFTEAKDAGARVACLAGDWYGKKSNEGRCPNCGSNCVVVGGDA